MAKERWKKIPGWERYSISSNGRVRDDDTGRIRTRSINAHGYLHVSLYGGGKRPKFPRVHVVVLRAFRGPPPVGHEGAHRDGNKLNCRLSNLRWLTRSQNNLEKRKHGVIPLRGSKILTAKLNEGSVRELRQMYREGKGSIRMLAALFKVSDTAVHHVVTRKYWRHVCP